jgi:anti-sigma-K factor RskA
MSTMHVNDSIPAYALGILEDAEQAAVRRHLSGCAACQEELRAYQQVVEQLPAAVPQRTPPLYLRAAILQRAAAAAPQPEHAPRPAWLAWITRPFSPAVGWLALAIIVGLVWINLSLWQQTQHPAAPIPTLAATDFHTVHLTPPQSSGATGLLVISDDGDFGTLVVDGLELLGKEQQYQLWLIKDGQRTSGGVFSVGENGYGMLEVKSPLPLIQYQSFGITVEPFGGSPGPTGKKVLGGSL